MESNLVQNLINLKSLPQTWVVKDFKEVVSDNSGGNKKLAKSNFLKEGDIAVVDQGKNLIAGFYNDTSLAVKTQPPYVVFGDHTRAFKYVDFPFIMGADGTKVLQPKKENCETKYLYYFFLSINVPNTGYNRHFKYLKELKIPLPPLDQQKKIAAILDAADAYRQKTKTLIEKYDELTQSLFLDMFGDPVTNPKGWEKVSTITFCDCIVPGRDKPKSFTGDTPWITTADLNHLGFTSKSRSDIGLSQNEISEVRARVIPKHSVIMTCVGDLGVVSINEYDIVMNQQLHAFICYEQLNNVFLMHNLSYQTPYMHKMASSTTVPYMNKTVANNTPTIVPPIELQNQFADRVQAIEAQKAQTQAILAGAEDLFNSLLQRAFKGELTD
jgi:type I restriction enzyme, S subunit